MLKNLYSKIPKVDQIIEDNRIKNLIDKRSRDIVVEIIRENLDSLRQKIREKDVEEKDFDIDSLVKKTIDRVEKAYEFKLKNVINATGTVIHTNLGRSLMNEDTISHIANMARYYTNLEYDLETGKRGSRYDSIVDLIKRITGAEDALVVNNNAAAVILALSSWGDGKEVITSRGELVEIGGSFRIPEVMEQSGAKLVEVGATNKTHISDYQRAINEDTGALLKVHTSNYRIVGFTDNVSLEDLVKLGREESIPVIEDLGSGVLIDLSRYGLEYEPTVQESVKAGVDIITFSGDKLLGGPQAGIIVGKSEYIDQMKRHPLNRAFRIDKFTISALESTLRYYIDEEKAIEKIPTIKMIVQDVEEIEDKAFRFMKLIDDSTKDKLDIQIVKDYSQVGGGSMPLERLESRSVKISSDIIKISRFEKSLRELETPIIGRIYKESLYLDFRTVFDEQIEGMAKEFEKALNEV
ncbi:MAG: L-seryl-tRNA(Sec) selenium transferase [Andreesenia angusta]|nr:L-seryl-tRNA(Sec) selenium transferase [Andreesenia angusta]